MRAAVVVFMLFGSFNLFGQAVLSGPCGYTPSDATFSPPGNPTIYNVDPYAPAYWGVQLAASVGAVQNNGTSTFSIGRVVGPGTDAEFDANGFLTNWSTYVQNGILSKVAYLNYAGLVGIEGISGLNPTKLHLFLNGHIVADLPDWRSGPACVSIPTQYMKFAKRNVGGSLTAGVNLVAVVADGVTQNDIDAVIGAGVVGNVTFQAMYPIILVHGIRSTESWFRDNGFTPPLDLGKVPYAPVVFSTNVLAAGGNDLGGKIPALAKEFGVSKVHIVAHSKGGLWARYFLKFGPVSENYPLPASPSNFGVLSMVTIDTPHHGSMLAEIPAYAAEVALIVAIRSQIGIQDILRTTSGKEFAEVEDLRRGPVEHFNASIGDPPLTFTDTDGRLGFTSPRAVAADADIGDKTDPIGIRYVDSTDCRSMFLPAGICGALYGIVGLETYLLGDPHLPATLGPPRSLTFDLNDLVVTQSSARYGVAPNAINLFQLILDPLRANHTTVGAGSVSSSVLGVIQQLYPVQ